VPANATYPWTVTYRLTIDAGTYSHLIQQISDPMGGALTSATHSPSCSSLVGTTIAGGSSTVCYYDVTFQAPSPAGQVPNQATIHWDSSGLDTTTSPTVTVDFPQLPPPTTTTTPTSPTTTTQPPATTTPPSVDLAITKAGAPSPVTINGQITWTMVVTNNGPNAATGVTVTDQVPSGSTFVSATSSQGSCANNAGTISCAIGGMANGASVTVTMVTTALVAGTVDNTATTQGNETETNTANNSASASVVVQALTPPKPSIVCSTINATPKLLYVGRHQTLTLHVTQKGKAAAGVHVRISGSGLHLKVGPSNAQGLIKVHAHPKNAGLVHFSAVAPQKSCGPARVGVTNVFTPPVTG
jgi:uncharacterized repeat protein (TIGR01451 family)